MKPPEPWLYLLYFTHTQTLFLLSLLSFKQTSQSVSFLKSPQSMPPPCSQSMVMQKPHGHWDLLSKELYHTQHGQQHRARHLYRITEGHRMLLCSRPQDSSMPTATACAFRESGETWVTTSACTNANGSHGISSITLTPIPVFENSTSSPNGSGPLLISPASFSFQKALFFGCLYKHTPSLLHCFSHSKNNVCSSRVSFGKEQKSNFKPNSSLKHFSALTVMPLATRTVV